MSCLLFVFLCYKYLDAQENSVVTIENQSSTVPKSYLNLSLAPAQTPHPKTLDGSSEIKFTPVPIVYPSQVDEKIEQISRIDVQNMTVKKRPLDLPENMSLELANKRRKQLSAEELNKILKLKPVFGLFHSSCKCSITCKSCGHHRVIEVTIFS